MSKLYLIIIILTLAVSFVWAQPVSAASTKDSKIMIVNAYSRDIFIQIEDTQGDVIMETHAVAPNDITRMLSIPEHGFYFINYKFSEADDWLPFTDDSYDEGAEDYMVNLEAGNVCCILIDGNGDINEHTLVLPESTLPLVCFCNISVTKLTRMEIGTDYMNDFVAFTTDIEASGMTDFTAIDAGNYGLCWESVASTANDEFTWLPDENDANEMRLIPFEYNNIYVFCVFNSEGNKATLFNITP